MKLTLDTDNSTLTVVSDTGNQTLELNSREAFEIMSHHWVRLGWQMKYTYTFSWMGRPVIQLPEDMVRMQEVVYQVRPDIIIETGVAHGGSLIFYASLMKAMGKGRVIGLDIEIRPHNRKAIEGHELFEYITLLEGDSVCDEVVSTVKNQVSEDETVLLILDSNHTKAHVLAELNAYADLVTPGSYAVATDGVMAWVHDTPRGEAAWAEDNPMAAAIEFAKEHPEFVIEQPEWSFNESPLNANVTHWPMAWLRRV